MDEFKTAFWELLTPNERKRLDKKIFNKSEVKENE